ARAVGAGRLPARPAAGARRGAVARAGGGASRLRVRGGGRQPRPRAGGGCAGRRAPARRCARGPVPLPPPSAGRSRPGRRPRALRPRAPGGRAARPAGPPPGARARPRADHPAGVLRLHRRPAARSAWALDRLRARGVRGAGRRPLAPAALTAAPRRRGYRGPSTEEPRMAQGRASGGARRRGHAATRGTGVRIDSWNLPLRHPDGGFLGDRASQSAFRELLDQARRTHATGRRDPFGRPPTAALGKREIDMVLVGGDPDAAHVVHLAVEEYARALAAVVRSFIAQPDWAGVRDIVLGGGFPDHEAGRLAIRRAARLLKLARSGV